jgi:hypothetical protein
MKLRSEIAWWIPRGSLIYSGTPKTRLEWVRLTWRGYAAYWQLLFRAAWLLKK